MPEKAGQVSSRVARLGSGRGLAAPWWISNRLPGGRIVQRCFCVRLNTLGEAAVSNDPITLPFLITVFFPRGWGGLPMRGALVLILIRAWIGGAVLEQFSEAKVPALPQHAHSDFIGLWDLLKATGGGEGIRTPGTLRFI